MKTNDINIRDPFVLYENGTYYLYGTRAKNFGQHVGGFDVYTSNDLITWSDPVEVFDSDAHGMSRAVNWAPEVHKYNGKYYMFATFTRECGLRGTFSLISDSPMGPFTPHSKKALTPESWECLDGSLYIAKNGKPYLVFCHEHTQIIDGTMCYIELNDDLSCGVGEAVTMFSASSPEWADKLPAGSHYITDGPFMYRSKTDELFMIWSTFIKGQYAECLVKYTDGDLSMNFIHLDPMITNDGGHGMIFNGHDGLYLTFHTPNKSGYEHPTFKRIEDLGEIIRVVD